MKNHSFFLSIILLLCIACTYAQLTFINSPSNYDSSNCGYTGIPLAMNNNLYIRYRSNSGNYDLAKYDGNALTIIPSPAGYGTANCGYVRNPIIMGKRWQ